MTQAVNLAAVGSNANSGGTLLISGTAVTASGTSVDFTGIPATAKRVTVMFSGVSTNGTSFIQIQLGNGAIVTTGYVSSSSTNGANGSSTTGFLTSPNNGLTDARSGIMSIVNVTGTTWIMGANIGVGINCSTSFGNLTLAGVLDRIRITTVNGTDTFDAGTINIMYE